MALRLFSRNKDTDEVVDPIDIGAEHMDPTPKPDVFVFDTLPSEGFNVMSQRFRLRNVQNIAMFIVVGFVVLGAFAVGARLFDVNSRNADSIAQEQALAADKTLVASQIAEASNTGGLDPESLTAAVDTRKVAFSQATVGDVSYVMILDDLVAVPVQGAVFDSYSVGTVGDDGTLELSITGVASTFEDAVLWGQAYRDLYDYVVVIDLVPTLSGAETAGEVGVVWSYSATLSSEAFLDRAAQYTIDLPEVETDTASEEEVTDQ